jgi:peptide methionine sulfoxide reductase MsrA
MIGIWWHDESQKEAIEEFVKELEEKSGREVRTPILPLGPFYEAEVRRREEREKGEREGEERERRERERREGEKREGE